MLRLAVLPLLLAGGCADVSLEEDATQQATWGPARHGLQARIALEKSQFRPGERIAVTFQVRNASTDPVSIPRRMEMLYQNTHLSFEGEPDTGLIGKSEYPQSPAGFVTLRSGEVYQFPHHRKSMELHVHASRPGTYTFWSTPSFYGPKETPGGERVAGVDAWTGTLESNKVRFRVVDGVDETSQDRIRDLIAALPDQTGRTEGYDDEFTIHLHEPAKSLIEIGEPAAALLISKLSDERPTKAYWTWRWGGHHLTVSEVAACILRRMETKAGYGELLLHLSRFPTPVDDPASRSQQPTIFYWAARDIRRRLARTREGAYEALLAAMDQCGEARAGEVPWWVRYELRDLHYHEGPMLGFSFDANAANVLRGGQVRFSTPRGDTATAIWIQGDLEEQIAFRRSATEGWVLSGVSKGLLSLIREKQATQSATRPASPRQPREALIEDAGEPGWKATQRAFPLEPGIGIQPPVISPDRRRCAQLGIEVPPDEKSRPKSCFAVVDDRRFGPYDRIEGIRFSADSKRAAFLATRGKERFVVVDGIESPVNESAVEEVVFSPDSRHYACRVSRDGRDTVAIDGHPTVTHRAIGSIAFAPDSRHLVYTTRDDGNVAVYLGPRKLGEYEAVNDWSIRLSTDSSRLAYACKRGGQWYVAFGDEQFGPFEPDTVQEIQIGPDSRNVSFSARQDGKWYFFTAKERHGPYEDWSMASFNPDGKRLAYCGKLRGRTTVYLDGKPLGAFDSAWGLTFSPDSRHFACGIKDGNQYFLYVDGERTPAGFGASRLAYSPDSRRLAAMIPEERGRRVVEGAEKGKLYDEVKSIRFSPDSEHLAYWARLGESWHVVIDGREVQRFRGWPLEDLVFDSQGKLCGAAVEFPEDIPVAQRWCKELRLVLWELQPTAAAPPMEVSGGPETGDAKASHARDDTITVFTGKRTNLSVRPTTLHVVPEHLSVWETAVSPDGSRLAYKARRADKAFVAVVDGKAGPEYEEIPIVPTFSPDSKRMYYVAKDANGEFAVLDGVAGEAFEAIRNPAFSPDGRRFAYVGLRAKKQILVVGGRAKVEHDYDGDFVIRPVFSPNGDRLTYYRQKGDKWVAVTDGKESRPYDAVLPSGPVFSPDGRHVAYAVWLRENGMCVVLDGVEQEWFEGIARDYPPVFSPDGRHAAYVASRGEYLMVIRDGEKGKEYRWIDLPVFSPDSQRLCYAALVGGLLTDHYAVIVGGQRKGTNRGQVRSPVFSPDGKRLAWVATRSVVGLTPLGGVDTGTLESVVVDGEKGKEYGKVQALTFCPQGRRLAYVAFGGGKRFVVVDGKEQEKFTAVGNGPVFSPDGKHVAYSAGDGQGHGFLVVDDVKYPIDCLSIVFTSPTTLRVLGSTDNQRRFVRLDVLLVRAGK